VVTMGAGDVSMVGPEVLAALTEADAGRDGSGEAGAR
jgi:UDP-N-acetylmuramate--alanine ligase